MKAAATALVRNRDIHRHWFDCLERMGESFQFRLGRYRPGMNQPEWFELPHQDFDGLGGLAHVLRTTQKTSLPLPALATVQLPSTIRRWMAAARLLCRRPAQPRRWLRPSEGSARWAEAARAWTLFSAEETIALRTNARNHGVSLNAWLLWGLAGTCLPHLAPGRQGAAWIVPINMRGAVAAERDTDNLASILDIAFPLPAAPSDVDAALRTEQRKLAHFGAWQLLQLVGRLHPRLQEAVVRHESRVPKHGSFSNLGRLASADASKADAPEWWMAFNPVIESRPIGMACLTWHDRMAVTLQIHPVLGCSEPEAEHWLTAWRETVLAPSDSRRGGTR